MTTAKEKRYRLSLSWDYEKEEEWLDERSAEGLHFEKLNLVKYTFDRDPSIRYTYRLDYQTGLDKQKKQEYFGLYEDAGWEYVSTYGGMWHYFRRAWKEGENPRLYTDRESIIGLYKRIQSLLVILFCSNIALMIVNLLRPGPIRIILIAVYSLLFLLLGFGFLKLNQKIKRMGE